MGTLKFRGSIGNIDNIEIEAQDIQGIIDQVQAQHPNFRLDHSAAASSSDASALEVRDLGPLYCCPVSGQNFEPVTQSSIDSAIQIFDGMRGTCTVGNGACNRVFCSKVRDVLSLTSVFLRSGSARDMPHEL